MHSKPVYDPATIAYQALQATFPVVAHIAGADRFADYVGVYHRAHPDEAPPLYGAAFPEFLNGLRSEDMPYLADVASLEWLVHRAAQAPDAPTLNAASLNAVPSERFRDLCLTLHPSCGLLSSSYPTARIWEVHQPGYLGELTIETADAPTYILVNRPGTRVEVSNIDEGGCAFLEALARGLTLGAAFDFALSAKPAFDLADALQDAVARRLLCPAA